MTRPRIRRRWLVVSGMVLTILAVVATMAMLKFYPLPEEIQAVPPAVEPLGGDAILLDPPGNRAFFESIGADHGKHVTRWTEALEQFGIHVRIAESLSGWDDQLLVLPHVYCLSDGDLALISKRVNSGASILIAGPAAVRREDGEWASWRRMHRLLGSRKVQEAPMRETDFLIVDPSGPIANLALAGYRIRMQFRETQWRLSGCEPAAYWGDFSRASFADSSAGFASAATARRGEGRIAWVGFDPGLVATDPTNRDASSRFLRGLISWCRSDPASCVDLWPTGKEAAMIIVEDTESSFANARGLDRVLSARGIRGGFMCVSDLALNHPDLVGSLAARHDIGSHSDDHSAFAGQSRGKQSKRLKSSANALSILSGRPIHGLRPPEEAYDETTLRAMVDAGYDYLLGDVNQPGVLPETITMRGKDGEEASIVVMPRPQADDYVLAEERSLEDADIVATYLGEARTVLRIRGLEFIGLHTHILGAPDRVEVIGEVLDHLPLDRFWVTGPDSLADWWKGRDGIRTEIVRTPHASHIFRIRNTTSLTLSEPSVWIQLPGSPTHLAIGGKRGRLDGPDGRGAYRIRFDRIEPHETIEIPLSIEGVAAIELLNRALDRAADRFSAATDLVERPW